MLSKEALPTHQRLNTVNSASWRRFYVACTGRTNGAHRAIVSELLSLGQTEVASPAQSHFLVVFCPIASRAGTDISEALEEVKEDKPIILVVMHHTFDPEKTVVGSSRLVEDQRVHLTVDYLFYEGQLLSCRRNHDAWREIEELLRVHHSRGFISRWLDRLRSNRRAIVGIVISTFIVYWMCSSWSQRKHEP